MDARDKFFLLLEGLFLPVIVVFMIKEINSDPIDFVTSAWICLLWWLGCGLHLTLSIGRMGASDEERLYFGEISPK